MSFYSLPSKISIRTAFKKSNSFDTAYHFFIGQLLFELTNASCMFSLESEINNVMDANLRFSFEFFFVTGNTVRKKYGEGFSFHTIILVPT